MSAASKPFSWSREYLISVLTEGKKPVLTDPLIINAFIKVDRSDFVPLEYKNKAYEDIEIDIGFGEKLTRPSIIAQTISLLAPEYGGVYLDIGTGSGYTSAILGFIAGEEGKVISLERVQWLWELARRNIAKYGSEIKNVSILYRDGLDGLQANAPYDGIHITFTIDDVSDSLKKQLKVNGGKLVYPSKDYNLHVLTRKSIDDWEEEIISGAWFKEGKVGIS